MPAPQVAVGRRTFPRLRHRRHHAGRGRGPRLGATPAAAIPTVPQPAELYDLNDLLTDAARPTANLITVTVHEDGTASFALPADGGRPGHHHVDGDADRRGARAARSTRSTSRWRRPAPSCSSTSSPAAPTPRSRRTHPIRVAAAIAKGALLDAAAIVLGDTVESLRAEGRGGPRARRLERRRTPSSRRGRPARRRGRSRSSSRTRRSSGCRRSPQQPGRRPRRR